MMDHSAAEVSDWCNEILLPRAIGCCSLKHSLDGSEFENAFVESSKLGGLLQDIGKDEDQLGSGLALAALG